MTAPLRHTKAEIRNAAQVARELGLAVRLESDGAITFIPATHIPPQAKQVDLHEEIKL